MNPRALLLCLMFACATPASAARPEVFARRVEAGGEQVFEVVANGTVKTAPAAVWKVLTDYERMPEFVPDLKKTKIVSRSGNRIILEQAGVARFMFFSRPINLVVQAYEEPMSSIDITLVTGDMKVYVCRWAITPTADGGTRVDYAGRMVPKFYVPSMLGSNLLRTDIERMMQAVLDRLEQPPVKAQAE
jgi:ribosome-associated toxin RatA of RatAB toxin-antitoxin module